MTGETPAFRFVGENLALDFVNTETTEAGATTDALPAFKDAVAWFAEAGLLSSGDVRALLAHDGSHRAPDAVKALHAFRGQLRSMLDELRTRGRIAPRHVEAINERLRACACARVLVRKADSYEIHVQYRFEQPRDLLMPIANAAAQLIAEDDLTRVKRCGSECCDMAACGNRAKAAAYYRRSRANGDRVSA